MQGHWELIIRIAVGAGLGAIIGFERDIHGRQAGLRTHLIVAMASATFMVVSTHFILFQTYPEGQHIEADVSRIAASVVSGIGFLAGGAILRNGITVQGLTTAAGLWLVSAIGLCSGAGMYFESVAVTIMGLIALTVFRFFEDKDDDLIRRYVSLVVENNSTHVLKITETLKQSGAKIGDFDYEKKNENNSVKLNFEIKVPEEVGVLGLIKVLEEQDGVSEVHVKIRPG